MPFSMMGTRGQVRFRLYPKTKRGLSGYEGKSAPKVEVERTHTVKPSAQKNGFKSRVVTNLRSLFGKGNR